MIANTTSKTYETWLPHKIREPHTEWHKLVPEGQWTLYREYMDLLDAHGLPFILGGAFALATYSGRWRNTKDLDCFIRPEDREEAIALLKASGYHDLYDEKPYQQHWIWRGTKDEMIIDLIWETPNGRSVVDDDWIDRAPSIQIHGRDVRVLPADIVVFVKLYVLQRDRCDWTDVLNVLYGAGMSLDWVRLLDNLGTDLPLLAGALHVFGWLCPGRAAQLPAHVFEKLGVPQPDGGPLVDEERLHLLDSRSWFGPEVRPDEPLAV